MGGKLLGPHGSSRSIAPVPKMQRLQNSKISNVHQGVSSSTNTLAAGSSSTLRHRQMASTSTASVTKVVHSRMHSCTVRIVKYFIPLMLTITGVLIVIVIMFETDSKLFESMKKSPEMATLRARYYAPIKNFFKNKLGLFWLTKLDKAQTTATTSSLLTM